MSPDHSDDYKIVDATIRRRRTSKVLGDPSAPQTIDSDFHHVVNEMMAVAGHAPFHYPAHSSHLDGPLKSPVPWRFYAFDNATCHQLLAYLERPDARPAGKIARLLAAAGAMVIVSWLPDPDEGPAIAMTQRNVEHVAAASCTAQNLLLAATARHIECYWSSGGILRTDEARAVCGIPEQEAFLGAIFLFPVIPHGAEVLSGSLRDKRGEPSDWATAVALAID